MEHNDPLQKKFIEKGEEAQQNKHDKPGGWAYAVITAAFSINFITSGILYSIGIMYVSLMNEFNESKGYTSWILSVLVGVGSMTGPIASFLVKKYGCRAVCIMGSVLCAASFFAGSFAKSVLTLIFAIGFGVGIGFGLAYLPVIVIVSTYFEKYRALATGISLAGSGLGTFCFAPIVTFLTQKFGWRGTLNAFSVFMLISALLAVLFRPFKSSTSNCSLREIPEIQVNGVNDKSSHVQPRKNGYFKQVKTSFSRSISLFDFSLFQDPVFMLFCLSDFAICSGYYVPYFALADRATELGISNENTSHLFSIIGIVNTLGRILMGYVSDQSWSNRLYVFNIGLIVCGVATALSIYCLEFKTLVIYAIVFGFTSGTYVTLQSVVLTDLLGLERLESAFGWMLLFEGISSFIGQPIFIGYLYDLTKSYNIGFALAGTMIALSGLILFLMPTLQKRARRKQLQRKCDQMENNTAF